MATLQTRIEALATTVGNYLRDSIKPRLIPAGGSTGQALLKTAAGNYLSAWADVVFGFSAGAGGTVAQAGNKGTAVTLSKSTGKITMQATALAAGTIVTFTLTNTLIAATDIIEIRHVSGGTNGAYTANAFPAAGSAVIAVRNNSAASLSEAIVLRFVVIKSADA